MVAPLIAALEAATIVKSLPVIPSRTSLGRSVRARGSEQWGYRLTLRRAARRFGKGIRIVAAWDVRGSRL